MRTADFIPLTNSVSNQLAAYLQARRGSWEGKVMGSEQCASFTDRKWSSPPDVKSNVSSNKAKALVDRIRSAGVLLFSIVSVAAVTVEANACEGRSPTRFYVQEIAPKLPPDQRNPFRMEVVARPNVGRGEFDAHRLKNFSDGELECWFALGDRVAAYTLFRREFQGIHESFFSATPLDRPEPRRALNLLLVAARPCAHCAEEFGGEPLLSATVTLAWFMQSTKLAPNWAQELYGMAAKSGHWRAWYVVNNEPIPTQLDID